MLSYIFLFCFLVTFVLFIALWYEYPSAMVKYLLVAMGLLSLWLLCDTLAYFIHDRALAKLCHLLKGPITMYFMPTALMFVWRYTGIYKEGGKKAYLLYVIPLLTTLSWMTNGFPFVFWYDTMLTYHDHAPVFSYKPGFGYYLHTSYAYCLSIAMVVMLSWRLKSLSKGERFKVALILCASIFVILVNVLILRSHLILAVFDVMSIDVTSILTTIVMASIYLCIFHSRESYKTTLMQLELERGLKDHEFSLYLQPQIVKSMNRYQIQGAELLIRWKRNGKILYRPDEFIPYAEATGMIEPIGFWIVDQVFIINERLRAVGIAIKLSINVSPVQLRGTDFVDYLKKALVKNQETGIDLTVEVTETCMMDYKEEVIFNLMRIRKLGVMVAMDDFGTGYSSLNYLRTLPIDCLKIDKTFVDDINSGHKDIVPHILDIANTLGIETVAEGVERMDQLVALTESGCHILQGYYFSEALEEEAFFNYYRRFYREISPLLNKYQERITDIEQWRWTQS